MQRSKMVAVLIYLLQTFPTRTEGSVKKHWYKDMHYAEFAEDEVSPHRRIALPILNLL